MKKLFLGLFLVFATSVNAEGWSQFGELSSFRLYKGTVYLGTLSSLSAADNQQYCNTTGNTSQFSFPRNTEYSDALLSMLLAAEMSGRQVRVYLKGTCFENRPEIDGVHIQD